MTITKSDFDFVRDLVRRESAIVLEPGKEYLVEARLSLLAKSTGHNDLASIVRELRAAPTTVIGYEPGFAVKFEAPSFFLFPGNSGALRARTIRDLTGWMCAVVQPFARTGAS